MNKRRLSLVAVVAALALFAVPMGSAVGDTTGVVVFTDGKAFVQCMPPQGGSTGLGIPGSGFNKGKKCGFTFTTKNAHKNDLHTCIGVGVSNTLKKGSGKPAVAQGITAGKLNNTCEITASGMLGPKIKTPLPPPLPQGGGPWCGGSHGISGTGAIKIGPKAAPVKTINFDHLRYQSNGTLIVVTARGFKDDPGTANPGQSGPVLTVVNARPDEHKIAQGVPNSSCLTGNKNFKVSGIALALLLGNK